VCVSVGSAGISGEALKRRMTQNWVPSGDIYVKQEEGSKGHEGVQGKVRGQANEGI
jgi:hypothetical protein